MSLPSGSTENNRRLNVNRVGKGDEPGLWWHWHDGRMPALEATDSGFLILLVGPITASKHFPAHHFANAVAILDSAQPFSEEVIRETRIAVQEALVKRRSSRIAHVTRTFTWSAKKALDI